jgi:hypothetical protein
MNCTRYHHHHITQSNCIGNEEKEEVTSNEPQRIPPQRSRHRNNVVPLCHELVPSMDATTTSCVLSRSRWEARNHPSDDPVQDPFRSVPSRSRSLFCQRTMRADRYPPKNSRMLLSESKQNGDSPPRYPQRKTYRSDHLTTLMTDLANICHDPNVQSMRDTDQLPSQARRNRRSLAPHPFHSTPECLIGWEISFRTNSFS